MTKKPEITQCETVTSSRIFNVEEVHLQFSNGEERVFERVKGRSDMAVLVIPMLDSETILLIREYGTGVDEYVLAFPKGALENEEDPLLCANRELMEEVGYGARKLTLLSTVSTSPGYLKSKMHLILAEDLYEKRLEGDEPEPLEIIPWKLSEIDRLLEQPDFHEARSIAAILLLERVLRERVLI